MGRGAGLARSWETALVVVLADGFSSFFFSTRPLPLVSLASAFSYSAFFLAAASSASMMPAAVFDLSTTMGFLRQPRSVTLQLSLDPVAVTASGTPSAFLAARVELFLGALSARAAFLAGAVVLFSIGFFRHSASVTLQSSF